MQGGAIEYLSESSRQHLSSVVDIFDLYSELWEQRQVTGDCPSPGTCGAASASLCDSLFSFGGTDGGKLLNTVHRLDTEKLCWSQESPQNADGAPMPKCRCGMIAFGNSLGVFGGYGIPQGPTEPQSFVENVGFTDGRGWTNEFHVYDILEGMWSCPATTGDRPPPCSGHTFTAVDDRRAVMFGGYNGKQSRMNDIYNIELFNMNWRKLSRSGDELWPTGRSRHAACCLNYGRFPQLLISGGLDRQNKPLADLWILDVEKRKWRKMGVTLKARWCHSLAAFSLGPGLTVVLQFGGTPEPWTGSDETQPKMAHTTLLEFGLVESSGVSQWELLSLIDNTQRGSLQRMVKKVKYFAERSQHSTVVSNMEPLKLQEEKERAGEGKLEIEEGREKDKLRRNELEKLMERERENLKQAELQMAIALLQKSQVEQQVIATEARAREAERMITIAIQERNKALEAKKECELQQHLVLIEKEGIEERARDMERERDQAKMEAQQEKEKSIQERNKADEKMNTLTTERDSAIEGIKRADFERERARIQAELASDGRREAEKLARETREENRRLKSEKEMFENRCKLLEEENERAKEGIERERQEKQKVELLMRKAEREKTATLHQLEVAEKRLRVLEEQILVETMQKSEVDSEYKTKVKCMEVEIEYLRQQLLKQTEKMEAEKLEEVLGKENERDVEDLETRAALAEEQVLEIRTGMAQAIRESESKVPMQRMKDSTRDKEETERLEDLKEEDEMKLQQAELKVNEQQQKLEVVDKHGKSGVEEEATKPDQVDNVVVDKAEVIAEMTVKITSEEQHIVWEGYGLRLHIPPNSLPKDCSELQLKMTVSGARDCELPDEDGILVSAVYSFSHNLGDNKLQQKVTLEMQHFVLNGSFTPLFIVQSDQKTAPQQFRIIDGGNFDSSDGYASIELDHFCSFCVYLKWYICSLIWNLKSCSLLYYTNIQHQSFEFRLFIAPQLDAIIKEIESSVERKDQHFKEGPLSPFEFNDEEEEIHLALPEIPILGWTMKYLNSDKMKSDDIVNLRRAVVPIPFHVEVSCTGDQPPKKLIYDTVIEGAKNHKLTVISPFVPGCETIASTTLSVQNTIQPKAFEGLPPPSLKLLVTIIGVDVQAVWEDVGLQLGLEPSMLQSINRSYSHDLSRCMTSVFTVWNESQSSEYSWKKLAEVLCSRTVNKPYLLPKMLERIQHSVL